MKQEFEKGDVVQWASQAGGQTSTKQGTVIAVIPARENIRDVVNQFKQARTHSVQWGGGIKREHTCYVVEIDRGQGRLPGLYVPKVSQLRKLEPDIPAPAPDNESIRRDEYGEDRDQEEE